MKPAIPRCEVARGLTVRELAEAVVARPDDPALASELAQAVLASRRGRRPGSARTSLRDRRLVVVVAAVGGVRGAVRVLRGTAHARRIDGMVALAMAFGATVGDAPPEMAVYEGEFSQTEELIRCTRTYRCRFCATCTPST